MAIQFYDVITGAVSVDGPLQTGGCLARKTAPRCRSSLILLLEILTQRLEQFRKKIFQLRTLQPMERYLACARKVGDYSNANRAAPDTAAADGNVGACAGGSKRFLP